MIVKKYFILLILSCSIVYGQEGETFRDMEGWKLSVGTNKTNYTSIEGKSGIGFTFGGSKEIALSNKFSLHFGMFVGPKKASLKNVVIKPEFEHDSLYRADVKSTFKPVEFNVLINYKLIDFYNFSVSPLLGMGYGIFNIVNSKITKGKTITNQNYEHDLHIGDYSSPLGEINKGGWINYYGVNLSYKQFDLDIFYADYSYKFYKGGGYLVLDQKIRTLNILLGIRS